MGWGLVVVLTIGIVLALTWRAWSPAVVRLALKTRGVHVGAVKWDAKAWIFENVETSRDGYVIRAKSVNMLRGKAWKAALQQGDTNQVYVTVNGWRVIVPQQPGGTVRPGTNTIAEKLRQLNEAAHRAQQRCPRAIFLNGTLQTVRGDFNFGVIDWKGGEVSGDFTWPRLNDPAEFRLKIVDAAKLQLIVRQRGLEIGSRATSEILSDGARLAGYARWQTNRVDFDLTYPMASDLPRNALVDSKGLAIPGALVGIREAEMLHARMRFVITNGQFTVSVGTPAESGDPAQ